MVKVLGMKTQLCCPFCQSDKVKKIIYGFPDFSTFDFEKYEVGGCCISKNDPKYRCSNCETSW